MFLKKKKTLDLQTIIFLKFNNICNLIFFEQEALWTHKNSKNALFTLSLV